MKENFLLSFSNAIRFLTVNAIAKAKSGHPGMPLGMSDVAAILFKNHIKFNPNDPSWYDADRFVLSAGHGSMLLYSILYLCGYKGFSIDDIKNFRQLHSKTPGHPEYDIENGIHMTTGPLGQGLGSAVGMAIAERFMNIRLGNDVVDHYTYVIAGDGCLMEGISHEAASLAGHLSLGKLIVFFDDNGVSIDGDTSLTVSDDHISRFKSYGWDVIEIDGHNFDEIDSAINKAKQNDLSPSLIVCKTDIAKHLGKYEGKNIGHSWPIDKGDIDSFYKAIGYENANNFVIDEDLLKESKEIWLRNKNYYEKWQNNVNKNAGLKKKLQNFCEFTPDSSIIEEFVKLREVINSSNPDVATRKTSGQVIESIIPHVPGLLGGSADLTSSNNTKSSNMKAITGKNFDGNYLYYGIREHAMGACMNGMSVHGGIVPYGGTFLVFSDYCRPSIRLSALMNRQVIYIFTHDSIGVGEDGPTHQPVEHLAALRAIPNLYIFRPADAREVVDSWECILNLKNSPSAMILSRQNTEYISDRLKSYVIENRVSKGAYVLIDCVKECPDVTIFGTGTEVSLAVGAADILKKDYDLDVRVVSVPCQELLFTESNSEFLYKICCNSSVKVAVEAGVRNGWERLIGGHGIFVGMEGFGASAPCKDLFNYFNITVDNIVSRVKRKLKL